MFAPWLNMIRQVSEISRHQVFTLSDVLMKGDMIVMVFESEYYFLFLASIHDFVLDEEYRRIWDDRF